MADVQLWPLVVDTISMGGTPVFAAYGPMLGGFITNPYTASDQNVPIQEAIFVNLISAADPIETTTTFPVQPGDTFPLPIGFAGKVSVVAATSGHRFAGIIFQPPPDFQASLGTFPPSGQTTLTQTIKSYLYQQYNDDDTLQDFVNSYNQMTQDYMTWFATIGLPVYTGLSGSMLDWVAQGLYGMIRPSLPSGLSKNLGMLNTIVFNSLPLNKELILGPASFYTTSDDLFKRILTWHFFKGDGKVFDVRWLKRRVMRFLTGVDGTAGNTDATYQVSVTFGVDNQININLQSIRRFARGGAIMGAGLMNAFWLNEFVTTSIQLPVSPLAPVFKAAMDSGVLEFPFQFVPIVNISQ